MLRGNFDAKKALIAMFAAIFIVPPSLLAGIGSLTLDSTFAAISVTLDGTSEEYAESDLVLEYQVNGASSWTTGHPLAKIEAGRYIGSILFLPEDTTYNVRVKVSGCGDSSCWETGQIKTRSATFPTGTSTAYYVSKTGSDSNPGTAASPFLTIQKAENTAQPGSIIHIAPGTYYESITVDGSGTSGAYIKYVGDGAVTISGADETYDAVDGTDNWTYDAASDSYKVYLGYRTYFVGFNRGERVFNYRQKTYTFEQFSTLALSGIDSGYWSSDDGWLYVHLPDDIDPDTVTMQIGKRHRGFVTESARYLIFENIEIAYFGSQLIPSTPSVGISIKHGKDIVIRHCKIHHAYYGIYATYTDTDDILIESNEFFDDPHFLEWPWAYNKGHDTEISAICLMAGGGNVVRNNTIHDSFNGINPGSWGYLAEETYNYNLDVYNNYIENIGDDCLEPEGANINTRIWNNTCKNVNMGISMAPITVGPLYVIRNKILNYSYWNANGASLKYANGGSYGGYGRIYIYHNTAYTTTDAVNTLGTIGNIGNMVYRNNIFYGDRYGFENYRYDMPVPVDWDYDCIYTRNTQSWPYYVTAYWYGLTSKVNAKDIAAFRSATGQELHGASSDPLFTDINNYNIALKENSPCRDTGVLIWGINDGNYVGNAPDMGAIEYGATTSLSPPSFLKVVSITPTPSLDTTAPTISSVSSWSETSTSAIVAWTTDEASDSQIEYGTTTSYGRDTTLDIAVVTSHSQAVNGLTASTLYHYRVKSKDAAGNLAISGDHTFTTAGVPGTIAPTISGVSSSNITATSAIIAWTTNVASDSQVEYGSTTSYGNSTFVDSAMVTLHSQAIGGLKTSTLYHYRVRSKDASGHLAISGDYSFTTTSTADTTAPMISDVSIPSITSTSASISWTTNEVSDSQIEYGTSNNYGGSTSLNSAMVTSHSQAVTGLTAATLYHYRVKSKDASGNLAISGNYTFTTNSISDKPINSWMQISPTTEHKTSTYSWEGSGAFDPYNRVWIHDAGHDAYGSVQAFALWTWDIDNGGWTVRFPNNGPPGS